VVDDSPFLNPDQLNGSERPSRRLLASGSGVAAVRTKNGGQPHSPLYSSDYQGWFTRYVKKRRWSNRHGIFLLAELLSEVIVSRWSRQRMRPNKSKEKFPEVLQCGRRELQRANQVLRPSSGNGGIIWLDL
jgi:hypothetical protein